MTITRSHVITAIVCLMLGYWLASSPSSPANTKPKRPVLAWIASTARTLLWVSLLTEEPPQTEARTHLVQVDADGYQLLDHGRGW